MTVTFAKDGGTPPKGFRGRFPFDRYKTTYRQEKTLCNGSHRNVLSLYLCGKLENLFGRSLSIFSRSVDVAMA